jgi:hypothetical protein
MIECDFALSQTAFPHIGPNLLCASFLACGGGDSPRFSFDSLGSDLESIAIALMVVWWGGNRNGIESRRIGMGACGERGSSGGCTNRIGGEGDRVESRRGLRRSGCTTHVMRTLYIIQKRGNFAAKSAPKRKSSQGIMLSLGIWGSFIRMLTFMERSGGKWALCFRMLLGWETKSRIRSRRMEKRNEVGIAGRCDPT